MLGIGMSRRVVLTAAVAIAVIVGFAGWWFFIRDDAPGETNPDTAAETLEDQEGGGDSTVEGEWTIDATIGVYDYATGTGTWTGYRIDEELANIGGQTAVGRTPDVTGSLKIAGNQVTEASFEVSMTTLASDQDRRDNFLKGNGLETDAFPTASFELTEPIDLPADAASGAKVEVTVAGELTLHGVTQPMSLELTAQLANGAIALNGQAPVALANYSIEPPSGIGPVLSVADQGTIEFQLFLSKAS